MNLTVANANGPAHEDLPVEMVERKGLGHPDTICDAAAENLSRGLSRWYEEHTGCIQHHNVDKALLVAGESSPEFGGGAIIKPMELILCGRATLSTPNGEVPIDALAVDGTRRWLSEQIPQLHEGRISIDSRIGEGSVDLQSVCSRGNAPLANDTSFAVAYAPLSETERLVLETEQLLNSAETKQQWPMLGTDVKIMGVRTDGRVRLTVAVAFIGAHTESIDQYCAMKREVQELVLDHARNITDRAVEVAVNTADDEGKEEVFLTVTGTSAEMGDDGQVGRGNRANGLITPMRPQSLEACAGKNPVNHVGKIYHVMARRIVDRVVAEVSGVTDATCTMVSRIGFPINEPKHVLVEVRGADQGAARSGVEAIAAEVMNDWAGIRDDIVASSERLF